MKTIPITDLYNYIKCPKYYDIIKKTDSLPIDHRQGVIDLLTSRINRITFESMVSKDTTKLNNIIQHTFTHLTTELQGLKEKDSTYGKLCFNNFVKLLTYGDYEISASSLPIQITFGDIGIESSIDMILKNKIGHKIPVILDYTNADRASKDWTVLNSVYLYKAVAALRYLTYNLADVNHVTIRLLFYNLSQAKGIYLTNDTYYTQILESIESVARLIDKDIIYYRTTRECTMCLLFKLCNREIFEEVII